MGSQPQEEDLVSPSLIAASDALIAKALEGDGNPITADVILKYIGVASAAHYAYEIIRGDDEWTVGGIKIAIDIGGSATSGYFVRKFAEALATLALGEAAAAGAPLISAVVGAVAVGVAAQAIWSLADETFGISDTVDAFTGTDDVEIRFVEGGAQVSGARFETLPVDGYGEALLGFASWMKQEPNGLSTEATKFDIYRGGSQKRFSLVPGMPVEAFIQTGERTAMSYLLKPLTDQFRRAMREQ